MAVLTAARFIAITDALAAVANCAKGASSNGLGENATEEPSDDIGARGRMGDLNAVLMGYAEDDYLGLMSALRGDIESAGYETWIAAHMSDTVDALDQLCADSGLSGVTSLTSFAAYYNTGDGGPWNATVCPDFGRVVYYLTQGAYLNKLNVYSPAIANMGSRSYGASFVAGTDCDDTKYCGVVRPRLTSASVSGSGTVTVVGVARDADGVEQTGRVWTVAVSGNTTADLTPAVTGDILLSVTSMTIGAGLSAGDYTVVGAIPSGRTNPPT